MPASHDRRPVGRSAALLLSVATLTLTALPGAAAAAPGGRGAAARAAAVTGADSGPDAVTARREQWQLGALHARAAWRHATGAGVTVGVIDSGVDSSHPDLAGRVLPGLDLVSDDHDGTYDAVGHGTTVAGLIAGRADDSTGAVGVAPGASILPVRVLDASNRYDDAAVVARGIRWAVDRGASVLNISLGGAGGSEALADALRYAFRHDVVVVACTGNLGPGAPSGVWFPARFPGVVAVSGLTRDPERSWRSAVTGPATALSAPATSLVGARPGGYWTVQGTSFAAPLVAASAALVRSRWPDLPAGQVIERLLRTSRDLGPTGRDPAYGYGAVDPYAALIAPVPAVTGNPLAETRAAGAEPGTEPGTARLGGAATTAETAVGPVPVPDRRLPLILAGGLVLAALVASVTRPRR
ncbi:hypothetical protein GCM10010123_28960 [Pilimelia anulata]|uniref:Peptidase S8/S53 domain-containing protein n=1 Tax=Pilimelia anulata TaxID=53371 RepID=A0A8J3FAC4_9ACTN|nr:type VII secretion-associated serine protease mycosin [Pilimelia anulata]GGJ97173.1 hypothetical protein GCM10010123_28960 [Pilimelia anulata]